MAEYIKREEAIHAALSIIESSLSFLRDAAPASMKQEIGSIPAADVQPVVRCRDCKYNKGIKTWIDNDLTADCTNGNGYPPLDWFCADGEKREEI